MSSTERNKPSRRDLRSFGMIVAAGFVVIGLWPVLRGGSPKSAAIAISLLFGAGAILVPAALRYPYRIWMGLGNILGWINSRVMLGVMYYAVMTPMRILMGLSGHDPMNRDFDPNIDTYRVMRKSRAASHMKHQF